jgi:hypothetical protein
MMPMRPLLALSRAIQFAIGTYPRPCYPRGWRARVNHFAIALAWMSRGYQYDKRTLVERLTDHSARAHFRFAFTGRFR